MTQWYYAEGNDQRGPAEEREIPGLVGSGAILADTLVWRDGMADWEAAQMHFPELFPAGSPPAFDPVVANTAGRDYRRQSGMKDAFQQFFRRYFDFSGRSNRGEFWFWVLDNILISIAIAIVDAAFFGTGPGSAEVLGTLWALATLIPGIAISVRRLHDIGKSGWWLLLILIPLIGFVILLVWHCQKPDTAPNRFN